MLKVYLRFICLAAGIALLPSTAAALTSAPQPLPEQIRLQEDLHLLDHFSEELASLEQQMAHMQQTFGVEERGHYTSVEHDQIENLLFRYRFIREALWSMVHRYDDNLEGFADSQERIHGFLIGYAAALHLAHYSSRLVATFIDDDKVIEKLNEPYHRMAIPRGSYDEFFNQVTSISNIQALKTAWELFTAERDTPSSALQAISKSDTEYARLIRTIERLHASSEQQTAFILKRRSLFSPAVANMLRQNAIAKLAENARVTFGDNLYAARGLLFNTVSGIKSPLASNMRFSAKQLADIKAMLQPGDIILTYSSGYMSNIFLPGKFKHGITYVGSPEQRKQAGLTIDSFGSLPEAKAKTLRQNLAKRTLDSGHEANLIEAVAEGVIFNSLEDVTDNHLGRMLILRPRLTSEQRRKDLSTVFLLLGDDYDFSFDFDSGARQCCTEVIYRALNGCGDIRFTLIPRMGVQTLSADDIILHYLGNGAESFDFVLLAEVGRGHKAVIHTGNRGKKRLGELMRDELSDTTYARK